MWEQRARRPPLLPAATRSASWPRWSADLLPSCLWTCLHATAQPLLPSSPPPSLQQSDRPSICRLLVGRGLRRATRPSRLLCRPTRSARPTRPHRATRMHMRARLLHCHRCSCHRRFCQASVRRCRLGDLECCAPPRKPCSRQPPQLYCHQTTQWCNRMRMIDVRRSKLKLAIALISSRAVFDSRCFTFDVHTFHEVLF